MFHKNRVLNDDRIFLSNCQLNNNLTETFQWSHIFETFSAKKICHAGIRLFKAPNPDDNEIPSDLSPCRLI